MIKVYLINLRGYNEGQVIGRWLELPAGDEEIAGILKEIGINDEKGEYCIEDYECDVPGIHINKNSSIDEVNDMANQLCEMDEEDIKVCSTIMKKENCTLDEAIEKKNSRLVLTLNSHESSTDVNLACSYIEQVYGDVLNMDKDTLARYFDFERYGADLKMNFNIDDDETIAVSDN